MIGNGTGIIVGTCSFRRRLTDNGVGWKGLCGVRNESPKAGLSMNGLIIKT